MKVSRYEEPFHYEVTCKRCNSISILMIEPEEALNINITCPICNCKLSISDSDKVYDKISVKK